METKNGIVANLFFLSVMLGIYLLHCPGKQTWRDQCKDRIHKVFNEYPVSIQGYKPGDALFDPVEMPIAKGSEHWSAGHVGCTNGHRTIMKDFLKTSYQFAVVFEDDVCFHEWVTRFCFNDAGRRVTELDPEWDWMMVSVPYSWPSCTPVWIHGTPRLDNIFRCSNVSFGCHAYMVSRKGAELLLKRSFPFTSTWDQYIMQCEGARVYHGPELGCMPSDDTDCESIAN